MSLLKAIYYTCLILFSAACAPACAAPVEQPAAMAADAPSVFYNDYLGLSISVPPDWQINSLSANLAMEQGKTATPQLIEYGSGSSRMELIDIESRAFSGDAYHSRFCAYAELFTKPVNTEQYVELLTSLLEANNNGYTFVLSKQEQVELSRHTAERVCLQVSINSLAEAELIYAEEYYIVPVEQGFIIFYINFWPQNEISRTAAFAILENITLAGV